MFLKRIQPIIEKSLLKELLHYHKDSVKSLKEYEQ